MQYNDGIPEDSRYGQLEQAKSWIKELQSEKGQQEIEKVRELTKLAESGMVSLSHQRTPAHADPELQCTVAQLALAWVVKINPNTSTVILGASKPEQIVENLKAIDVLPKLTPEILKKLDDILGNAPSPIVSLLNTRSFGYFFKFCS